MTEPRAVVRAGYDAVSYHYRGDADAPPEYARWLAGLSARIPAGASVLDLGCGCGVPLSRDLAAAGYRVSGVDISPVQVGRARQLVPTGSFVCADVTATDFPGASFDAVVCLYVLIHLPLPDQPVLLGRLRDWLRPGGWLLASTGATAWTGSEDNWLGGGARMWWSHADAATYRRWLDAAGFDVVAEEFVPEGGSGHQLFWARRPVR